MATSMPTIANLTGAAVTQAGAKTEFTTLYSSLREQGDPLGSYGKIQNLALAFSVAANALTCAVKQRDGSTNADATNVIAVPMRSSTGSNGSFNMRNITAALSLTISSGSTLGHLSATASYIYWYLIDNSGTLELAASTKFFGINGTVSTTAEGGAGAADSDSVMYSTTARSGVAFVCIGRTKDTQTVAGTWTATPSTTELAPFDVIDQPSADIASATALDLSGVRGFYVAVTGTTAVTSINLAYGQTVRVKASGAFTLTNGANLICPDGANVVLAVGDTFDATGESGGVVRITNLMRATNPTFSAYKNASTQSITQATYTKVTLDAEEFDTNSNFDSATNSRFTPTVAGKYMITGMVTYGGCDDAKSISAVIYKNGSRVKRCITPQSGTVDLSSNVSAVIDFNGSTDYVELYTRHESAASKTVSTGSDLTYLAGFKI